MAEKRENKKSGSSRRAAEDGGNESLSLRSRISVNLDINRYQSINLLSAMESNSVFPSTAPTERSNEPAAAAEPDNVSSSGNVRAGETSFGYKKIDLLVESSSGTETAAAPHLVIQSVDRDYKVDEKLKNNTSFNIGFPHYVYLFNRKIESINYSFQSCNNFVNIVNFALTSAEEYTSFESFNPVCDLNHLHKKIKSNLLHERHVKLAIRVLNSEQNNYNYPNTYSTTHLVRLGVCAVNKKLFCKPMYELIRRWIQMNIFDILLFPNDIIFNCRINEWPEVDVLLCFFSEGFPLDRAIQYADLRRPFLLNDLRMQYILQDRAEIYKLLSKYNISVPRHQIVYRDPVTNRLINDCQFKIIDSNSININGVVMKRPFVEKPVSADDHNIFIYYPSDFGGGCQRLFRKIDNRSSVFSEDNTLRSVGSFIYEEFVSTLGTDVKVYSVGDDYAHAEARKSPSLDGVVHRDVDGKEVRYPVILSSYEKYMAKRVCEIFKQNVCGFDLLRSSVGENLSFVCDVNGFSFVKKSVKYYDDCSYILSNIIINSSKYKLALADYRDISLRNIFVNSLVNSQTTSSRKPSLDSVNLQTCNTTTNNNYTSQNKSKKSTLELRCVVGIFRHGDRTPKQKMKMAVNYDNFWEIFLRYDKDNRGRIKLKKPDELQEILSATNFILGIEENVDNTIMNHQISSRYDFTMDDNEEKFKLLQMKYVLEMYGHFSGINRKVQIKRMKDQRVASLLSYKLHSFNIEQKNSEIKDELLLILKWGGELTDSGLDQANKLGEAFRNIYPDNKYDYNESTLASNVASPQTILKAEESLNSNLDESAGNDATVDTKPFEGSTTTFTEGCSKRRIVKKHAGGLLRLHSTYRHDLKVYASDEGRVQLTAASFCKGMLALESSLPSILVHLINTSKSTHKMLDAHDDSEQILQMVKYKLNNLLKMNRVLDDDDMKLLNEQQNDSLKEALKLINNPSEACKRLYEMLVELNNELDEKLIYSMNISGQVLNIFKDSKFSGGGQTSSTNNNKISNNVLYHNETELLMKRRWKKLVKDFLLKDNTFAINLIPDIYDCAKYDYLHNYHMQIPMVEPVFHLSRLLACVVIPLEYGISIKEKVQIGKLVCNRLLKKILTDLRYVHRDVEQEILLNSHMKNDETLHKLDPQTFQAKTGLNNPSCSLNDMSALNDSANLINAVKGGGGAGDESEKVDSKISSPNRHVRTRLYFTSESHIYGLMNVLWYGGLFKNKNESEYSSAMELMKTIDECDFLSQIVIMQYEDPLADVNSEERFQIEIYFSPGDVRKKAKRSEGVTSVSRDETKMKFNIKKEKKNKIKKIKKNHQNSTNSADTMSNDDEENVENKKNEHEPTNEMNKLIDKMKEERRYLNFEELSSVENKYKLRLPVVLQNNLMSIHTKDDGYAEYEREEKKDSSTIISLINSIEKTVVPPPPTAISNITNVMSIEDEIESNGGNYNSPYSEGKTIYEDNNSSEGELTNMIEVLDEKYGAKRGGVMDEKLREAYREYYNKMTLRLRKPGMKDSLYSKLDKIKTIDSVEPLYLLHGSIKMREICQFLEEATDEEQLKSLEKELF